MEVSHAVQALGGTNTEERRKAAEACAKDPSIAMAAIVPLCRCCGDRDEQVSQWSQAALEELGPPEADELESLLELTTSAELTAYWAVTLVGRLQAKASPAAAHLANLIEKEDTPVEVRNRAIWAIGQIGAVDESIKTTLEKAAQSENARTARLASKALSNM
ncbi:hypothetical protein Pan97_51190 [Bremerella volcania]|uniref:HEAT repeat protein n=1 Tax=Bremerella volcania TaxID=2527984 RepID=A0A518CFN6_9BACT|nr:hypothetical protein [Bremerella volcania]QDU78039.1 hypothetical protein Pan97_51190 [Bremerella volcania]